ncbi:MAG TPA: glycoside hydrolase family 15 protein [Gemmatimonadaceae bacterium]|nr:glycoside hydrolase family 15 protein [Gemmatimonadaceae bacterium]
MTRRIEDYALIGDCETGALIGRDGSIDWLCWPRFDSGACFAALLGGPEHGRFRIAPTQNLVRTERRYRGDSMILETTFVTATGAVTVVDFMPPVGTQAELVRMVVGQRGEVAMHAELILRFGYGSLVPWVTSRDANTLRAIAGPDMVVLHTDVPLHGEHLTSVGDFTVREGETKSFILSWRPSHKPPPDAFDTHAALRETEDYWRDWSSKCRYEGEYREPVMRSLLTLKALTYGPTGGIVAAPTTSLPEEIGGTRNWDYRVCWLRDATLTLVALMDAGYYDEARDWRDWLLRAAAGSPDQVQIMYGLAGERRLVEWEVPWLPGYEGSRPVRIGNAAHDQLQLDVWGEVMDALHQARRGGMPETEDAWQLERALVSHLERVCPLPDHGIWEVRGPPQHFTHSKVMAWVALDRAIRSAEMCRLDGPIARWTELRRTLHAEICERAFDRTMGSFVQSYGSSQVDASLLLMPLVGFLPASDERMRGTVRAIEGRLFVDGFVYRYDSALTDDGLPPGEGAFLACTFWLADNYLLQGRHVEARQLFERLLSIRNDVGLLAEEYHSALGRQVGNFPQAFSHVALVSTAFNMQRNERRAQPRRSGAIDTTGNGVAAGASCQPAR